MRRRVVHRLDCLRAPVHYYRVLVKKNGRNSTIGVAALVERFLFLYLGQYLETDLPHSREIVFGLR